MTYRFDINALRALAVLAVVLYHFQVPGFTGGFIGVDVFFVISGFLMTEIIDTAVREKRFSLAQFYLARCRRILPALLAMVFATLAAGWFFLLPDDYKRLANHAWSAVLFVSNFVFFAEDGYFDQESIEKWLLHTWSLSVEWQFYVIYPLLLFAGLRYFSERRVNLLLLLTLICSLLSSYLLSRVEPKTAFYLLPARVWEFLLGGFVYFYAHSLKSRLTPAYGYLGLGLIVAAAMLYSDELTYPSLWPILPALGAALSIATRPDGVLLRNRLVQTLGTGSYSIYLWHWPVLIAFNYFSTSESVLQILTMACLTGLLSYVSYLYIETPFRRRSSSSSYKKRIAISGFAAAVCAFSFIVFANNGVPARIPKHVVDIAAQATHINPLRDSCYTPSKFLSYPECTIGDPSKPKSAVFWGDSHSDSTYTGVSLALRASGRAGVYYGLSGCAPFHPVPETSGSTSAQQRCRRYNAEVFKRIISDSRVKDVILVGRWSNPRYSSMEAEITESICAMTSNNKVVHVLMPIPQYDVNIPVATAKAALLGEDINNIRSRISYSMASYTARNREGISMLQRISDKCAANLIDPTDFLCPDGHCSPFQGDTLLYYDHGHLNENGSTLLSAAFVPFLNNVNVRSE